MARLSRSAPLSPSCSFLCLSGRGQSTGTTELTCRVALWVVRFSEAEIVTVVEKTRMLVFTVNVAVVDPAGTVAVAGTVATDESLLERETRAPPLGAGPFRVSDETTGGMTVSEAVFGVPPP